MVRFFNGDSMSGLDTEIGRAVASGRQAKISIALTAPALEGTYTGYWILADEYGTAFGMPFYVQIVVESECPRLTMLIIIRLPYNIMLSEAKHL